MRSLYLLPIMTIVAGCNSEPSVTATNASVEDVQKQVAAAGGQTQMRPGRWEGTIAMKSSTAAGAAGAPGGSATQPLKICVTEEQVRPGANPFTAQMQQGCKYDRFKMADGKIDALMTCTGPGITVKNVITGTFTADSYKMSSVSEASGEAAGPLAGAKAETSIDAKRTGDCRGDETKS